MTIKNSLISIVASAAIITAITGCSSDSTTAAVAAAAATTDTGIPSSVQAVDGYIYNATVTAYYLAEDNASMVPIVLDTNNTTKDISTQVVTMGSSTYTLPSGTNSTVQSRIRFTTVTNKVSSSVGTTFTPASYIEGNNIDGYDANDTLLGTTTLYAPGMSDMVSPLTTLVYNSVGASVLGTTTAIPTTVLGEINATTYDGIEANATALATKLGLSGVEILYADPVALAASNPTYRLVTALMKDAPSTAAATLLAGTTPTTLAATLTLIGTAQTGTAQTLANTLAASAANGGFTTADVAGMNIEKSVAYGTIQSLANPVTTGKFPLNAITIDGSASSNFVLAGAKVDNDAFNVDFNMSNVDGNISNTTFNALVYLQGNKSYVANPDSNKTGAIVVKVPFDLNSTSGVLAANVPAATVISYQGKSSSGNELVAKDMNATTALVDANNAISIVNSTSVRIDVDSIITGIRTAADANLTSGVTGLSTLGIADVKVYLEDPTGAIIGVTADGLNSLPLAKGSFSDFSGVISSAEALKALYSTTLDLRSATNGISGANSAPDNAMTIGGYAADTNASTYEINATANTALDFNMTTVNATDTMEKNTTVAFTLGAGLTDVNLTNVSAAVKHDGVPGATGAAVIEANATADKLTTLKAVVTDEFGKATTVTSGVLINVGASFSGKTEGQDIAWDTSADGDTMTLTAISSLNSLGNIAINVAGSDDNNITVTENNTTGVVTLTDLSTATEANVTITITDPVNSNLTFSVDINKS